MRTVDGVNKDWSWPWLHCMSMVDCYLLHLLFMSVVVCMVYAKHNVSLPVT